MGLLSRMSMSCVMIFMDRMTVGHRGDACVMTGIGSGDSDFCENAIAFNQTGSAQPVNYVLGAVRPGVPCESGSGELIDSVLHISGPDGPGGPGDKDRPPRSESDEPVNDVVCTPGLDGHGFRLRLLCGLPCIYVAGLVCAGYFVPHVIQV